MGTGPLYEILCPGCERSRKVTISVSFSEALNWEPKTCRNGHQFYASELYGRELLPLMKNGSHDAWNKFKEIFFDKMWAQAYYFILPPYKDHGISVQEVEDRADDIMGEILRELVRNVRTGITIEKSLIGNLLRRVRNRSKDHLRAKFPKGIEKAPSENVDLHGSAEYAPDKGIDPWERLNKELLELALNKLREEWRRAIDLVDLQGEKIKDAAIKLGSPEGTVKSWLFYGRIALRSYYKKLGG